MSIWHSQKDFYQLKELEKIAPSEFSAIPMRDHDILSLCVTTLTDHSTPALESKGIGDSLTRTRVSLSRGIR